MVKVFFVLAKSEIHPYAELIAGEHGTCKGTATGPK